MMLVVATAIAPPFLVQSVAIVVAAAVIAYLSYRIGLVPIVGFLIAGVVIGPHGLSIVADLELVDAAAEIGVILLLFTIGIEFSLEKLARIQDADLRRRRLAGIARDRGCPRHSGRAGVDWHAATFYRISRLAVVDRDRLEALADRGETTTTTGQVMLALLIFQDLAVIVMVLVVPMLGREAARRPRCLWALGKALALILTVLLVARRLMPKLLERVALTCSPELFLLTVIAMCFGTAWLTSTAGVSLSLGAFLAGLVGEREPLQRARLRRDPAAADPVQRDVLRLGGDAAGPAFSCSRTCLMVVAAVGRLLAVKMLTTGLGAGAGLPAAVAAAARCLLAQVGEFSFVLKRAGREAWGCFPLGRGRAGSQTFHRRHGPADGGHSLAGVARRVPGRPTPRIARAGRAAEAQGGGERRRSFAAVRTT